MAPSSSEAGTPVRSQAPAQGFLGLALLLLGYVVGLTVVATLWPFDFQLGRHGWSAETSSEDLLLNLGLLFPVAFLYRLRAPGRRWPADLDALLLGLGLSALLETCQTFLPTRCASPTDVVANGLGAWAGAHVCTRLRPWLARRLHDELCLMLPLTKVLYLAAPLLSLQALTTSPRRGALHLLGLVLFVALVAAALLRHRVLRGGPLRARAALGFALAFAGGIAITTAPIWFSAPASGARLVAGSAVIALLALWGVRDLARERRFRHGRRFEVDAVRRALPWFLLNLAAIALSPFVRSDDYGAPGAARGLCVLRDVAAFTLLGYLLRELHARSRAPAARIQLLVGLFSVIGCATFAMLRLIVEAFDLAELGLFVAAAALGAAIHRAELAMILAFRVQSGLQLHSQPPGSSLPPDLVVASKTPE